MTAQPDTPPLTTVADVIAAIRAQRYAYSGEDGLQAGVAAALDAAGLPAQREVRLSATDRLDVLSSGVAIEVKLTGAVPAVLAQLQRYAAYDQITALVLVTTRARHRALPLEVGGKTLAVVQVGGAA
jgi:hypothetical protein